MPATRSLLIVYHSMTGGTRQMAEAAGGAARTQGTIDVRLRRAPDTGTEDLLRADGYIFATPENLAAMSGLMKDFFDRTYYGALERLNGRPYAIMVCAGSDGRSAVAQLERIALGWRLRRVAAPLILCTHASSPERILAPKLMDGADLERCAELGATLAGGLSLGIY